MADDELQELVKQNIQDVLRNFQDFVSAPATSGKADSGPVGIHHMLHLCLPVMLLVAVA